ncbi:3-deoxy-D-manno-oct-2-ulosonic acid (Kdo) hydroxylase [Xylophilus rhododendri]|uniref:3-deoxy-D-manno-oct-2-ulosonic acid (Kdo) hydroxylase n=1 Tax=Xylophilus rhododendri TaxID=2697032 RepID=A0A857J063_9BURK|nr:Kdo hydroxylase family protein [Xylophilus rhododendri]QHI96967.1 3-deoxy-D-manno-oct-2-ulosonic acid (Kdo) hydroxylase [Xylophilus rhododendri]
MEKQILELDLADWKAAEADPALIAAVEAGKVLYFPRLHFTLWPQEAALLRPDMLAEGKRNISLDAQGQLKGAAGSAEEQKDLAAMVGRFRANAVALVHGLLPDYRPHLRLAPTSFRPTQVESRTQSWRADDKRLHVDAFPSRPNRGERILRVFANVNPMGQPRVWRVGEPFEDVARRFLPKARPYARWQAKLLQKIGVTKSLRSEYDHLMLQLHDGMKGDALYQQNAPQATMPFAAGSAWVCFSDQTPHAVMGGQFMLEQTLHLPPEAQYNVASSPLAILTRLAGHPLIP